MTNDPQGWPDLPRQEVLAVIARELTAVRGELTSTAATVKGVGERLDVALEKTIPAVEGRGRRTRLELWVLAGVVAALAVIGGVVVDNRQIATDAEDTASGATDTAAIAAALAQQSIETQKKTCEFGNESRSDQREFWDKFKGRISALAPPDPVQAQRLAQVFDDILADVAAIWGDRDCTKVGKVGVTVEELRPTGSTAAH